MGACIVTEETDLAHRSFESALLEESGTDGLAPFLWRAVAELGSELSRRGSCRMSNCLVPA